MPSSYQSNQDLSITIPYRRSWLDRAFESCLLGPLVHLLLPLLPRPSLPRDQLKAVGIQAPNDLDRRLLESALLEIFRLLTDGWNRLDRTALDPWRNSNWSTPGPTLFLSMHHGQWEWLAAILTVLRPGALCVAKAPTHPTGRWLLRRIRNLHGLRMVHDLASVRTVHRHLERQGLVAFLADQRPPGSSREGFWMGHPTPVSTLPDRWIQKTSPRIWTGVLIPFGDHYRLQLREWDSTIGSSWDLLLDQEFRDLVAKTPWHHFGLWHHRLKPRTPRRPKPLRAS
jgi:hypothetical protein